MCYCDVGFHGEDCGIAYVNNGAPALPVLTAGHFNVTQKQHRQLVKLTKNAKASDRAGAVLVLGYSSPACARCVVFEHEYAAISTELTRMQVRRSVGRVRCALA